MSELTELSKAIVKIDEKLDDLTEKVIASSEKLNLHVGVDDYKSQQIQNTLDTLSGAVKDNRSHFDKMISDLESRFDSRISNCDDNVHAKLNREYSTKSEIELIIFGRQKRIVAWMGSIVAAVLVGLEFLSKWLK